MAYPDQKSKLRYILDQDDQTMYQNHVHLSRKSTVGGKKEYLRIEFSHNLGMEEWTFSRAYNEVIFFPEKKIGHKSQYEFNTGQTPINKIRFGKVSVNDTLPEKLGKSLLVEFLGLDYSVKSIEEFYNSFCTGNEADFIACCEKLREGRGTGPDFNLDGRISLASLFARAPSEGCALYQQDYQPHSIRMELEAEYEAPISRLELGVPVRLELYSPAERDGRTALWNGRSVLLFERQSNGLTRGVLPCLASYPGWKVETFPRNRNLVLPGADAQDNTLWKPQAKEIGSYEMLFVVSEVAPPPEIRDGIIRQALPDTAPELLRLADWIGAQAKAGKAELRKVAYEIVG